ncbi:hypothetical protein SVIOM74S_04417 [Streptomyces violarus]
MKRDWRTVQLKPSFPHCLPTHAVGDSKLFSCDRVMTAVTTRNSRTSAPRNVSKSSVTYPPLLRTRQVLVRS